MNQSVLLVFITWNFSCSIWKYSFSIERALISYKLLPHCCYGTAASFSLPRALLEPPTHCSPFTSCVGRRVHSWTGPRVLLDTNRTRLAQSFPSLASTEGFSLPPVVLPGVVDLEARGVNSTFEISASLAEREAAGGGSGTHRQLQPRHQLRESGG